MRPARLTLALTLLALPGCFDSHLAEPRTDGGVLPIDGGGAPTDGGMCGPQPATVMSIACTATPGGAIATITTSPTLCCASGTVTPAVRGGADSFDIDLSWIACGCSATLECIGPIQTIDVPLGALTPGRWEVRAGGSSCTLDVPPNPPECRPGELSELRMASILLEGQPFAATAIAPGLGGCGCNPSLEEPGRDHRLQLCGCCDTCDCIDAGYEVSSLISSPGIGRHEVTIPHGVASFEVKARDRCRPMDTTSLEILSPDPTLVQSGPPLHWAVLEGTQRLCCVPPRAAIDRTTAPDGSTVLTLQDCVNDDCECAGSLQLVRAMLALPELPPGRHTVRAGGFATTIDVP